VAGFNHSHSVLVIGLSLCPLALGSLGCSFGRRLCCTRSALLCNSRLQLLQKLIPSSRPLLVLLTLNSFNGVLQ
jgi:hypothetical protein